ncbi:MAG: hypothetical protein ACO28V_03680 [Chitinophagaceae bacterium]|jgi:hypothetical protein
MKFIISTVNCLTALMVFLAVNATGQSISSNVSTNFFVEAYNIRGRPFTNPDASNIEGTPLLNQEWGKGTVYFKDGSVAQNIDLKFNLEKNELYFNRDGELFMFNDPIMSFRMSYSSASGKKEVHFRSGYPVNGRLLKDTFYEVLEDGAKFHFVAYRFSYLADSYRYGGQSKKAFTENEELYVFDVAFGKMLKIKRSEASLIEALPDYKDKIVAVIRESKLKMKTNEDVKKVFTELNK